MAQLTFRPITRADVPALTELLAAAEAVDRTDEHYNAADLLEELDNPLIDPTNDWMLVESGGRLVAHGALSPRAVVDGVVRVSVDGTVRPEHRRQGIGSALVVRLVERARRYAAERDARATVVAFGPSDNADQAAVLGRHGFEAERWQFMMTADLAEEHPQTALPDGYSLETWEDLDPEEILATHNVAFADHFGFTPWNAAMWEQWVTSARNARPGLSLLARDEQGQPAGYVHTMEYDAVAEATGIREAYLSRVGTVPGHRRKGLAGALLGTALARYRDAGFDRAALDVDSENPTGALGVYQRAGFRTQRRWTNYRLTRD